MIPQERETEEKKCRVPDGIRTYNLPGTKQLQIAAFPYTNSIHGNKFSRQHGMLFYRLGSWITIPYWPIALVVLGSPKFNSLPLLAPSWPICTFIGCYLTTVTNVVEHKPSLQGISVRQQEIGSVWRTGITFHASVGEKSARIAQKTDHGVNDDCVLY